MSKDLRKWGRVPDKFPSFVVLMTVAVDNFAIFPIFQSTNKEAKKSNWNLVYVYEIHLIIAICLFFMFWMQFSVDSYYTYAGLSVKVWHISWYLGSIKDYKGLTI